MLGHVCRKRSVSNTKIKFRDISSHFCVKSRLTLSPIHIFVAFFTYSGEVVITFGKIETFICQSQKQNLVFKLDNFWLSKLQIKRREISRCKETFSYQNNDSKQNK